MIGKKLWQQLQPARIDFGLTISFGFLAAISLAGQAFFLSRIIAQVFLEGASLAEVQPFLLGLLGLSLLRAALVWVGQVTAQRLATQVKNDLRERLTGHLLALGPAYSRNERSGELANTAVEGVEALDPYFSQYLPQLVMAVLAPVAILLFIFPLDVTSGFILLVTAPLIPIFMILIGSLAKEKNDRQWRVLSQMGAHFLDVLQGLTTLKLLGRSREQIEVIGLISDRFRQSTMAVLRVAFLSALALELLSTLSVAIVAVGIGLRLLYGYLEFEQALFVLILAPEFYLPLRLLGTRYHAGQAGVSAAKRIFEILETPLPAAITTAESKSLPALPAVIRFDEVYYSYDQGQRPALQGISFTLQPGQKVALVGPSGAGKSTVAQLLLGFIQPTQGTISIDGQPLAVFDLADWRQQVAWAPQNPYLFHGSVIDNIRLARPEAGLTEVIEAARQAQADTFIQALPQGYETLIGERGIRLSGGQAQRLALARAFLKDAPLLILDEATANLDPGHETYIQAAISRLVQGRMALIIAHRLSTVYSADQIWVMASGKIVETGTHPTLLREQGLYSRLVTAYGGVV